ncbi:ileal sodium/bile acid cotransporter-like [Acanthaster planci]|uniref:Ileal sodium/bile acid cotransporter-like n=1 Tax=Acanthaster planci TaxID=133434 RepID=A0A8B7Z5E2_ACAPL|nr:ileal sodium/bile acid cotransporter-like [Acanthaster planci]
MDAAESKEGIGESTILAVTTLQRYLLLAALALSSLLYGSKMTPDDFTKCVKKPLGLWLAMMVSALLAPLTAFVISLIFSLHYSDGLTLLITSICPAGALSPIFAFYTQADVCLCLSVIVLSTLMSVGMIPLGVYLCSNAYTELDLAVIPNNIIVITLSTSIGFISLGMALRNWKEKVADRLVLALSYLPVLIPIIMIFLVGITIQHSVHFTPSEIFPVLVYLLVLLSGTYLLGHLAGQTHETCRAMAFSAASKSVLLSLTVVHSSFTGEVLLSALPLPNLFLIEYIVIGLIFSAAFWIYRHYVPTAYVY